ncbi:odorant receptor 94a-like [Daktulosphaira vitifoliae]|uniref:odorant receptor 94a-like n=1 Tax=Daktulosphaira vitifoliae TaxID=58002 RepID=UPI0021AA922B|nr:odorant receptor 94a-like [Daktulosphaira vitifoliae]
MDFKKYITDFKSNNMIVNDELLYIANVKLAGYLGLILLIDPNSPKMFGFNVYHIIATFILIFLSIIMSFCIAGLYFWSYNIVTFSTLIEIIINGCFMVYKILTVMRYSKNIWNLLNFTRIDFMKYMYHDRGVLEKCRERSLRSTNLFSLMCYCICLVWTIIPLILRNHYLTIKTRDGIVIKYHLNVYSVSFMVSETFYNDNFYAFYLIESIFGMCSLHCSVLYDIFLISACYALSSQLKTLNNSYKLLGLRATKKDKIDLNKKYNQINDPSLLDEIKCIIVDHQVLIKKMEELYDIVRPVILTQLVISSNTLIFMSFMISLTLINKTDANLIEIVKMLSALPIFVLQLYLDCFLFGNIDKQKNDLNFSIYSSDWINMDSKCSKLILFAMRMNNANPLTMKITYSKIVNLEMFVNVIRLSYSTISVLMKSNMK